MSRAKERTAKERKRERRGLLVEQFARNELALGLQGSLLSIPILAQFIARNVRYEIVTPPPGTASEKSSGSVVATLDPNYAGMPIPEARREAIEQILEEHIGGLFLLPNARRARARVLLEQIEKAITETGPAQAARSSPAFETTRLAPSAPAPTATARPASGVRA